jgi:hypothetical protein
MRAWFLRDIATEKRIYREVSDAHYKKGLDLQLPSLCLCSPRMEIARRRYAAIPAPENKHWRRLEMTRGMKLRITLALLALGVLPGCISAPWHENLMSNDQLVAANCQELAAEQKRVSDNAQHTAETSKFSAGSAMLLLLLEGKAARANGTPLDTENSAAMNSANASDEHTKQSGEFENRKNMIELIRSKKGCS